MYVRAPGGCAHLSIDRRRPAKFILEIRWRSKQSYLHLSNLSAAIVNFYGDRYTERRREFRAA